MANSLYELYYQSRRINYFFYKSISAEELKSYNELEKREELKNIKRIKRKFQFLNLFNKFYNIMDIRSSANRIIEFLILIMRMILLF
jgi:hypothetical protein